jgi:hypothetical protein
VQQFVSVDAPVIAITNVTLIDGTGGLVKTGRTSSSGATRLPP